MATNHDLPPDVRLAEDPADHVGAYCATFATGSGELLDHHYEAGAVLVPRPGQPLTGTGRVAAHRHLLGFGLPITAQARHVYVADDIALLIVDWSIRGTGVHGHQVDLGGTAADVARRGSDGRWRYVIDNPFGTT
jgi:ketosteroid isomerase-like protein